MRKISSLGFVLSALVAVTSFGGCDDDGDDSGDASGGKATGGSSTGGSSTGGSSTGGANGGSAGTRGGAAGSGMSGSSTGGRAGSGGSSGTGGDAGAGDGGMGTGGDPGGAGGDGGDGPVPCGFEALSSAERAALGALGPLPATLPADTTNQYADNAAAAALGQRFFFDKAFSGKLVIASDLGAAEEVGKVACSSCHLGESMEDHRSMPPETSRGANVHARNAPGMVNSSFYAWTNWAGRFSAQWELPLPVSESPAIMNGNRLAIAHRIAAKYKTEYEAIFGTLDPELGTTSTRFPPSGKPKAAADPDGPWELMQAADRTIVMRVWVNFGKALQAYTRKLVSRDAAFDEWLGGECDAISGAAERGALLFVGKAGCTNCHSGSHLSDDGFHNLGVPQGVPTAVDQGRFTDAVSLQTAAVNAANATFSDDPAAGAARLVGLTNPMPESARGTFRTPNLRGVAETGPYMHSGQLATLEAVVDFYDAGGGTPVTGTKDSMMVPLGLTAGEKADLVAFLRTLTGEPVLPALLVDTSAAP